jgi:hypothetical protein
VQVEAASDDKSGVEDRKLVAGEITTFFIDSRPALQHLIRAVEDFVQQKPELLLSHCWRQYVK